MAKKLLARLVMDGGSYALVLADGTIDNLSKEDVCQFILSFNEPSRFAEMEAQVI